MSSTLRPLPDSLRLRIEAHLRAFERLPLPLGGKAAAAVAAVITGDERGEPCFLITRRARGLRRHSGQWALPGGRLDPGETPEEAALRELCEEVGLALPDSSVLGCLDDYATRSGFCITPVVVWAGEAQQLIPNPEEVAAVYRVPLAELEKPGVPRLRRIPQSERPVISIPIPLLRAEINAPTAAVLYQLSEVAICGRSTRVSHYEQPVFAWK